MNKNFLVFIACIVGPIATVVIFIGIKHLEMSFTKEQKPDAFRTIKSDSQCFQNHPHQPIESRFERLSRSKSPAKYQLQTTSTPDVDIASTTELSSRPTKDDPPHSMALYEPFKRISNHPKVLRNKFSIVKPVIPFVSEPLIFTNPGSLVSNDLGRDEAFLETAKQLAIDLAAPGYATDSHEYLNYWNQTVDLSNRLLRQRYGGQIWMAHHIQSYHLRNASEKTK